MHGYVPVRKRDPGSIHAALNIETYFKLTKSYLKLRTECHSTSYDAITSHMVVVAIRYMILSVERFKNSDNRSLEDL